MANAPDDLTRIPDPTDESLGTASARAALLRSLLDAGADELTPRYQLREALGRGGMGEVVEAFDQRLQREVALKRLAVGALPVDAQRFVREAQLSSRLDHPNVLPVYDLGVGPDGALFFTMKRLHGRTLSEVLRSGEELSLHRRLDLFLKVCDAVAYAHAQGVLHRDLKPSNVMLGAFHEVWVLDWGLAKRIGEVELPLGGTASRSGEEGEHLTTGGTAMGTPGWLSPEQARGEHDRVGVRSDVFSLGVLLYLLLTDEPPFEGRGKAAVVAVVKGAFVPPRERRPGVSWELDAVVRRAMAYRAEDRFASVDELREEVQRWVEGQPLRTLTYGPARRVAKWGGRHWRSLAAVGGIAALLGVVGLVGLAAWALAVSAARDRALDAEGVARAAERDAQVALGRAGVQLARAQADLGRHQEAVDALDGAESTLVAQGADPRDARLVRGVLASRFTPAELVVGGGASWAALAPDGDTLVQLQSDRQVRVFGLTTGAVRSVHAPVPAEDAPVALGFWGDRPVIAVIAGSAVEVRDLDGAPVAPPLSLPAASGGTKVLLGDDVAVVVAPDGTSRVARADGRSVAIPGTVYVVSADGATVAGLQRSGAGVELVVWDARTGAERLRRASSPDLALSPDGARLALRDGGEVRVVRVSDGRVAWSAPAPPGLQLRFGRGGAALVAAGSDDRLWVYDAADGRVRAERRLLGLLNASRGVLLVARAGDRVATQNDAETRVWTPGDGADAPLIGASAENLTTLAVSADGLLAASGGWDGVVRLWEWRSRSLLRAIRTSDQGVRDLAFSPDDRRLLTADRDGAARLLDPATGAVTATLTWPGASLALACTFLGEQPLVAFDDGTIAAFRADGQVAWSVRGAIGRVWSLLPSPDGQRLVVVGRERDQPVVEVWSVADRAKVLTGPIGFAGYRAAFAPDGGGFVVATHEGALLRFTGDDPSPAAVPLRDEALQAVGWSPRGLLAVGAYDGQLELLDPATFARVQSIPVHDRSIVDLVVVPGEDVVLTASGDGRVGWFDAARWARTAGTAPRWAPDAPALREDGAAWAALGDGAAQRGSWAWAATCYDRAVAAGTAVPPIDRARAAWASGRREEARRLLDEVLAATGGGAVQAWRDAPDVP